MEPWLTQALVGTAKQSALADSHDHPVLALAEQLPTASAERRLLLGAGAASIYSMAGCKTYADVQVPSEAPRESQAYCSPRTADLVREILEQPLVEARLLSLAFEDLETAGQILPPALVPRILLLPSRLRPNVHVHGVLGERGRWLAQFCDDWNWAFQHPESDGEKLPADAERIWQEGALGVRVELLALARRVDPAKAREWLAGAWSVEKAEARQQMLGALHANLSSDDVPLLEQALKDRSAAVRSQATKLLSRIIDSPLALRMRQRAEALLQYSPATKATGISSKLKSLVGGKSVAGRLEVSLPEACPTQWVQDGIELKTTISVGERVFWFSQIMTLVPPTYWSQRFEIGPAELLAATGGHDHESEIVNAWLKAAVLHASLEWLTALWDYSMSQLRSGTKVKDSAVKWQSVLYNCAEVMPADAAESRAIDMIAEFGERDGWPLQGFTEHLPMPWSESLGSAVVKLLSAACQRSTGHKTLFAQQMFLLDAALALPISQADSVLALEPNWEDVSLANASKSILADLQRKIRFRQQLSASIASK